MNIQISELSFAASTLLLFGIFLARALIFAGGAQAWISLWPKAVRYRIVSRQYENISRLREIRRGLIVILFDAVFVTTFVQSGLLVIQHNPLWYQSPLTFLAFFVWFEIYFYFSHRGIHHPKLFWIHSAHHEGKGTSPFTSLSFSLFERLILLLGAIGIPAIVSQWVALPAQGIALYFLVNYVLNVYGHMNHEILPQKLLFSRRFQWVSTATSHSLHHLRFKGNYGLFTRVLDNFCGTSFDDYDQLVTKVKSQQPIK
jgi:lathosterol oxidase